MDVEGILVRQAQGLDWPYVIHQLEPLAELKEAPEIVPRLERMRTRILLP
jgi:hypothetical protein